MSNKNPIVHVEWWTRDPSRVRGFYEAVFNWKFDDNMPNYTMINTGSTESAGGIMPIEAEEENRSPGIRPYIQVEDLAAYEDRVVQAGGEIVLSRREVPNMGSFSLVRDVDNNVFGLWETVVKPVVEAAPRKKSAPKKKKTVLKAKSVGGSKAKKKTAKAGKSTKKSKRR